MLKLYCSCVCLLIYFCYSYCYVTVFLTKLCFLFNFFVIFLDRILFHWKDVFLGPNQLTHYSVSLYWLYSFVQLLKYCYYSQLWYFMVKKGLRMKCVMLFPKCNIKDKISTRTNFAYITWYYSSTVAATNKKACFGEYLLQVFI